MTSTERMLTVLAGDILEVARTPYTYMFRLAKWVPYR